MRILGAAASKPQWTYAYGGSDLQTDTPCYASEIRGKADHGLGVPTILYD